MEISVDGCNATTRKAPCAAGGQLDLWTSPKLHGDGADWKYVGPMVTTPKTPLDNSAAHEFVTSGYFGSIPGPQISQKLLFFVQKSSQIS